MRPLSLWISVNFALWLMLANFTLRQGGSWGSVGGLTLVGLVAAFAHLRKSPIQLGGWRRQDMAALTALIAICWLSTAAFQLANTDDDYWIHSPVQAQIYRGELPPHNPFLTNYKLGGHFARDLVIAGFSHLTGWSLIRAQWWVTNFLQLNFLVLLFSTLKSSEKEEESLDPVCWGAAATALWGVNALGKTGLATFTVNNTCLVYLWLVLCWALFCRCYHNQRPSDFVLLGLIGGGYAQVYETHFGLFWMACVATLAVRRSVFLKNWKWWTSSLLLATALALTQGGPITDLLQRPKFQHLEEKNQAQQAQLSFPKHNFLQLWIGKYEIQPKSAAYACTPMAQLFRAIDGPVSRVDDNYVPLWSWAVLKMHCLPLYLCPVTLVWALRRRSPLWLNCWFTGVFAFIVPGVVDFGPIHEHEYLRWEFCASLALSIPLGGLAGQLIGPRWWLWPAYAWIALAPGFRQHIQLLQIAYNDGPIKNFFFLCSDQDWILRHSGALRIGPNDLAAMASLSQAALPGDTVLVNFNPNDPWGILFESTLLQRTGLESVGHALPDLRDPVGQPPNRQSPQAAALLRQPSLAGLKAVGCDWIYTREAPAAWCEMLQQIAGVTLHYQLGSVKVYHFQPKPRE